MPKFKNEYEYLIHLVRCALRGEQAEEKPPELSFEKVFAYGKQHEVANIAFVALQQLKERPEAALYKQWKTFYAFSLQRHANQMHARDAIVDALNHAGIRNIEVQGTVMKTLYPHPEWRMMSDIDFIIDKENLGKADAVMQSLGYKTKQIRGVEIDAYGPYGIAVELHSDFFDARSEFYGTITDAFSMSEPSEDGLTYTANGTVFYLYNVLHCIKHHLRSGAGIRRMMDMYIINCALADCVDRAYVDRILTDNGCKAVCDEIFKLAFEWFGDGPTEEENEYMKQSVYLSGNHGAMPVFLNNEYRTTKHKFLFKFRKRMRMFFPEKEDIYDAYPVCNKYRMPVAVCWVYRWFSVLLSQKKRKTAAEKLSEIRKWRTK